jgi:hypothetical protein
MITQVMVDIETLDTGTDALILSIGAVEFRPAGVNGEILPVLGREYYCPISQQLQSQKWKRTTSQATVAWWDRQAEEAQRVLHDPSAVMLDKALLDFSMWLGGQGQQIWANPAMFDVVILESAYRATSLVIPWSHRQPRCYKTLRGIIELRGGGEQMEFLGTPHNALDDAKYQALNAAKWLRLLGPAA